MKNEVREGGLWCHQVLEALDEWVDGELPAQVTEQVAEHVSTCDRCARFGSRYARLVRMLRTPNEGTPRPEDAVAAVADRLLSGLTLTKPS